MKFLLAAVNAKYIHSNPAIYSLRSYAVAKEPSLAEHILLAEYTINHELSAILSDIYQKKPDAIGFSCYIWNWNMVRDLVRELHKLLPGVPIWLGGPEVSYEPEQVIRELPEVAGVMVGEGEETFLALLHHYCEITGGPGEKEIRERQGGQEETESSTLSRIPGLYLPDIKSTGMRKLTDLSDIPFFYEDLSVFKNRILYYESSRGCPFRCSYCLSSIDKTVRLRDLELVKRELQYFLDHKVPQVKFVDRTFNCNHAHAMGIWQYIKEHDNGVTNFHFEIEADLLTDEELELLHTMRPGLAQMEIGVQSTNPVTLQEIRRYTDMDKLRRVVAGLRDGHNIHVHLDLIAGLPYEDYASFKKSFNDVYAMHPEQLQLGFLKVLKGSYMYEKVADYGLSYLTKPPYEVLFTRWLPYEAVIKLKRIEEMVELYYNSNQFCHVLPVLEQGFADPFSMYEALAAYYEAHGYYIQTPSRAYRYEALLQFAKEQMPEREDLLAELLTYDMYLRENLKARASFMKEQKKWYPKIQSFYEKEEAEPCMLRGYEGYHARQLMKMTHMEVFEYPVWEETGEREKLSEPVYILFDYRRRDPLRGDARTAEWRESEL